MSNKSIVIQEVDSRLCVGVGAFGYCNTKYHKPYLAVVDEFGEFVWQERVYVGYGKHQQCYYIVEGLNIGDVIQAAGGSGDNKYPHKARVEAIDLGRRQLEVQMLSAKEFSNIVGPRKRRSADVQRQMIIDKIRRLETELADAKSFLEQLEGVATT